ncbi:MAG: hypothetical protein ABR927_06770 [Bacteroidales bacterium]|jgi:hypothetical protein
METIQWYNYLASFFSGVFLANAVPHFIHGISGDKFPTPFSKPSGKGLSSPVVNTLWACFNLLIGYILYRVSEVSSHDEILLSVFFIGIVSISVFSSITFSKKQKDNGTK